MIRSLIVKGLFGRFNYKSKNIKESEKKTAH